MSRPPPLAPQWRRSVPPRDSRGCGARGGCGGRGAERGTGAGVRPLSPAPGAGRTAAAPGPGLGRGAALPVRRDKPQPLRSTEGAAGRSRSSRRVADPPLFTFPPPLPLPPRLLPGSAAARQVPASAPAGPSRRTRAPAPRRPFVWDRHRDPRPPTPPTPPRPLAPPLRYPVRGRMAGERGSEGGRGGPARGAHPTGAGAGGSSCPGTGGWSGGGTTRRWRRGRSNRWDPAERRRRPEGGGGGRDGRAGGRREGGRGTSRSRL